MKKAVQVVFLIDLEDELLWKGVRDDDHFHSLVEKIRGICIRLLTYFAAQHCVTNGVHTTPNSVLVKWGYKFYLSRSRKTVHQRYNFHDLELDALEQFERDLDNHLKKVCSEWKAIKLHGDSSDVSYEVTSLEQALRELVCDFPWDSPYISTPVKRPRQSSPNNVTNKTDNIADNCDSSLVDNYTIVITSVPGTISRLNDFLGINSTCCPSYKEIIGKIISKNVQQRLCNVAKVRLLWLDTISFYSPDHCQKTEQKERYQILEVIHQSLSSCGGGILPIGTVLLRHTLRDGFAQLGASSHRFQFPESYRIRIPFASIMSIYLNYPEIPKSLHQCEAFIEIPHKGVHGCTAYSVDLLPLFNKEQMRETSIPNSASSYPTSQLDSASEALDHGDFHIRCLKPLGKMKLSDMQSKILTDYKMYICCPRKMAGLDNYVFQELLDNLVIDYNAMVVSCDSSHFGLLVPANDDACVAVLYLLLANACSSTNLSVGGEDKITNLVLKLMTPLEMPVKDDTFLGVMHNSDVPDSVKRWLLNDTMDSEPKKIATGEEELIHKLEKCNQTFLSSSSSFSQQLKVSSKHIKRHKQSVSRRSSNMISKSLLFNRMNKENTCTEEKSDSKMSVRNCSGISLKAKHSRKKQLEEVRRIVEEKDLTSVTLLQAGVKDFYEFALQDDKKIVFVAQAIIQAAKQYYHQDCASKEERNNKAVEFLLKDVLLKSGDLSGKYVKLAESQKRNYVRECCLQVVLRLEMQLLLNEDFENEIYTREIINLLRKLSFVADPSIVSSFLQDTIQENYYASLSATVVEISEELNQPLPDEKEELSSPKSSKSSASSISSEICEALSSSQFSQLSAASTTSPCHIPSKSTETKRSAILRHPSFSDVSQKRQIVVPSVVSHKNKTDLRNKKLRLSSVKKRALSFGKLETKGIRRNLFHNEKSTRRLAGDHALIDIPTSGKYHTPQKHPKPTTPKGRHILKTNRVAETPLHKQVSHVALVRQRKKRKAMPEADDDLEVKESPDKIWGNLPFRRSPRVHASSLERQASFYASNIISGNFAKEESRLKAKRMKTLDDHCQNGKCISLVMSETSSWEKKPLKESSDTSEGLSSPVLFVTQRSKEQSSDRRSISLGTRGKSRFKRTPIKKRNLESVFGKMVTSPRRSRRLKLSVKSFSGTSDVSPLLNNDCLNRSSSGTQVENEPPSETVERLATSNDLAFDSVEGTSDGLVALECGPTSPLQIDTTGKPSSANREFETERIVISTPLRNGVESPTECEPTECLPFPNGPLTSSLEECISRSSSPRIPLLVSEMGIAFDDLYNAFTSDYDDSEYSKSHSSLHGACASQNSVVGQNDEQHGTSSLDVGEDNCTTEALDEGRGSPCNVLVTEDSSAGMEKINILCLASSRAQVIDDSVEVQSVCGLNGAAHGDGDKVELETTFKVNCAGQSSSGDGVSSKLLKSHSSVSSVALV